jgi:hypothetical protein
MTKPHSGILCPLVSVFTLSLHTVLYISHHLFSPSSPFVSAVVVSSQTSEF